MASRGSLGSAAHAYSTPSGRSAPAKAKKRGTYQERNKIILGNLGQKEVPLDAGDPRLDLQHKLNLEFQKEDVKSLEESVAWFFNMNPKSIHRWREGIITTEKEKQTTQQRLQALPAPPAPTPRGTQE